MSCVMCLCMTHAACTAQPLCTLQGTTLRHDGRMVVVFTKPEFRAPLDAPVTATGRMVGADDGAGEDEGEEAAPGGHGEGSAGRGAKRSQARGKRPRGGKPPKGGGRATFAEMRQRTLDELVVRGSRTGL